MNRDLFRLVTFVIVVITLTGAFVTITHPHDLPFRAYLQDVAIMWGLLGIGHGIDAHSKP